MQDYASFVCNTCVLYVCAIYDMCVPRDVFANIYCISCVTFARDPLCEVCDVWYACAAYMYVMCVCDVCVHSARPNLLFLCFDV